MNDAFAETLQSWQTFYFTTGGASATLVGLMFVALSLGMNLISEVSISSFELFVTPSIFYFVSAMLVSLLMLIPNHAPILLAGIIGVIGLVCLIRTARFAWKLTQIAKQNQDFNIADWLGQVITPVVNYLLLVAVAVCFGINQWSLALTLLWIAVLLLMICGIANTWSLVVWIIERRKD